jgi:hypothetical protein
MSFPRLHPRLVGALCALSLAIAGGALAPAAEAGPSSLTTGLSGLYEFEPQALAQTKATGAQFVRVVISWKAVAPVSRPANFNAADPDSPGYTWSEVDEHMRAVIEAGMTPLALVTEAPKWAERCTVPSIPSATCDPDPNAFGTFARAAALHYDGSVPGAPAIRYWEPVNEPNLSLFLDPQFANGKPISGNSYRKLLNSFYASVHGVSKANQVVGGGLGPSEVPGLTVGPMKFTRQLLCMTGGKHPHKTKSKCEGGVHFDLFDIHPYTTGGPTHEGGPNDLQLGQLPHLQKLLKAAKNQGRIIGRSKRVPIWVTEFSWDSKPPDPGGLPMRVEKRWVPEAMYVAWKAGVENFFWYSLRDEPITAGTPASESIQSGLYFRGATVAGDKPKPYLQGFRFPFVAYPGKSLKIWGVVPGRAKEKVAIEAKVNGRWQRIKTVTTNAHGLFQGSVRSAYGRDEKGSVRAVVGKEKSLPFAMKPIPDFKQPPFG